MYHDDRETVCKSFDLRFCVIPQLVVDLRGQSSNEDRKFGIFTWEKKLLNSILKSYFKDWKDRDIFSQKNDSLKQNFASTVN